MPLDRKIGVIIIFVEQTIIILSQAINKFYLTKFKKKNLI